MTTNRFAIRLSSGVAAVTAAAVLALATPMAAQAAETPVYLYTADSYAVLAGSAISNTGPTTITGDVGLSPNGASSITDDPTPGMVITGSTHAADGASLQAQNDLTTAYNDAAGRSPLQSGITELGGLSLTAGTYRDDGGSLGLTGTVTLNGDASSVFVFQANALTTASSSRVVLGGTVNACNVFWQIASSATLGTNSSMVGTVMALTSITATTGATVQGRLLARNGAVTLDSNIITAATGCDQAATAATIARLNAEAAAAAQAAADAATQDAADEAARLAAIETTATPELASTGFDPVGPIIGTVTLLGLGAFLLVVARRRAHRS